MFGFWTKKGKTEAVEIAASVEEEMGLKEYVSFDSVKAHLVDILEENRRLKREADERKNSVYEARKEEQKKKELALIEADEWKKRAKEKEEEIKALKRTINEQDKAIEELTSQQNSLKTEAEMAREAAAKVRREYMDKKECTTWLKDSLKRYCGYEWERVTKTQLIDILKTIMKESGESGGKEE